MLKLRENVPPKPPEPLTPAAMDDLFRQIRAGLGLPASDSAVKESFPRASDADYAAI